MKYKLNNCFGKLLSTIIIFTCMAVAQDKATWNNKKCAVCLTYDDALTAQLDNVVPLLDSLDIKATFYISGYFPGFKEHMNEWKTVAEKGNELGNHTLFHPCDGMPSGRDFVTPDYDLNNYSVQRMTDEIRMNNILLKAIDGKTTRTFAYPCGDTMAGGSSYVNAIKSDFVGARGVEGKMQKINDVDLFDICSYVIDGQSGDSLVSLVKQAIAKNALLVFLFHGVGGGHDINVSLEAHRKLLYFLKQNENEIWIAPLVDIAKYIAENREKNKG